MPRRRIRWWWNFMALELSLVSYSKFLSLLCGEVNYFLADRFVQYQNSPHPQQILLNILIKLEIWLLALPSRHSDQRCAKRGHLDLIL
jgi:hypothetical protein